MERIKKSKTSGNKNLRRQAEVAAEHWLVNWGCVLTRRCLKTQYAKVDFFGADVVAKNPDGSCVYVQVTTGGNSAVSARRRKLEAVPWHPSEIVLLFQLYSTKGPRNSKVYWFRIEQWEAGRWLKWATPAEVPREWFKVAVSDSPLTD